MSVVVKGMKMPKKCSECAMSVNDPGFGMCCGVMGSNIDRFTFCSCRLPDCPLVDVKTPHGRLIDSEVFFNSFPKGLPFDIYDSLINAPTVLEADE